ncbi:MAG: hypothetical protein KF782_20970 [Labilithrix sp.]|nr:hypothetical protein [Labilithrix sp.]
MDLDVALVDPSGRRAGAVSRLKNARVEGATSRDRETVALSSNEAGSFLVEVARTSASDSAASAVPVSGTVTPASVRARRGRSLFTLPGARVQVGRVDVRWEAELVPVDDVAASRRSAAGRSTARRRRALERVGVQHCASSGQVGTKHATVTFGPTGRVPRSSSTTRTSAGRPRGRCVQTAFFTPVPSFTGGPVRVGNSRAPLAR